jgi:putative peptidoglycan lipid II flippase
MSTPTKESPTGENAPRRRSVAGAAGSVSAATMVSRVLGVLREMVMARYFGAGLYTDAFNVAYRIPNLLRDLFAEGALSSAFVPTFVRYLTQSGRADAWQLANRVINALVVLLGGVTILIYFGARWFVYLLAAGYADIPQKFALTVEMTRIMSPFLLWVALAAVAMGMLNACGSFFIPAMAPSAFNICCILAGIFLSPLMPRWGLDPIISMAIGALAGGVSQFFVQIPSAYRAGFRYRFSLDFADPGLRHIAKLMLPAIIGLSATQINITVDNQLASRFGNGPVSWLNYAFRLMQLPIGVFGVAIATATTATVSLHAAQNSIGKLRGTVSSSLRLAACLTFPATVGLIVFREEIVRLLYQRGSFLAYDTLQTSRVLLYYALALFAYSAVKILVPTFYALDDTRTPVRTSMTTVAIKIAVNFALVWHMQFLGLALATAVASWLNFALLMRALARRTSQALDWRGIGPYLKIALASVIMGGAAWCAFRGSAFVFGEKGQTALAINLAVAIACGMAVIMPLLYVFRVEEASDLAGMVRRRLARGKS